MAHALASKRTIISTPFASQFDDIDKALFEYCYRKQTQQYNSFNNHNQHHNQHQHQHHTQSQNQAQGSKHHHNHHNHHHHHHGNHGNNGNNKFGAHRSSRNGHNNNHRSFHPNNNSFSFQRANGINTANATSAPTNNDSNFILASKYNQNLHQHHQNFHHQSHQQNLHQHQQHQIAQQQAISKLLPLRNNSPANHRQSKHHYQLQQLQQQQQQQEQIASGYPTLMQHAQPASFNGPGNPAASTTSATTQKLDISGLSLGALGNVTNSSRALVSSPDTFLDDFISPSCRMSSSGVNRAGAVGSVSAPGSAGFDFVGQSSFFDLKPSTSLSSVVSASSLLQSAANNASANTNSSAGSVLSGNLSLLSSPSSTANNNSSTNSSSINSSPFGTTFGGLGTGSDFNDGGINHRTGWLNVWGNDMSVWA